MAHPPYLLDLASCDFSVSKNKMFHNRNPLQQHGVYKKAYDTELKQQSPKRTSTRSQTHFSYGPMVSTCEHGNEYFIKNIRSTDQLNDNFSRQILFLGIS
jgi:hypothetical protein